MVPSHLSQPSATLNGRHVLIALDPLGRGFRLGATLEPENHFKDPRNIFEKSANPPEFYMKMARWPV